MIFLITAKSCPYTEIPHGRAILAGVNVDNAVYYICSNGYVLIGKEIQRCFPTGEWSGTKPECKGKNFTLLTEHIKKFSTTCENVSITFLFFLH